ncbi:UNVERIFIED_ORG: MoaA/NifB/PqqE/SkfB family radical SAM enzyme [Burkholderia contaminans]|nr:MoaA/NifB/PqqE/SkfB family radical SAM enzyme [Burkholderia contaminans]
MALELTQACNYRCVMCDYWRIPDPKFMPRSLAVDFLSFFPMGQLESVLFTGGEPLLHPEWREIVDAVPPGVTKLLCTNGSPILKKNGDVAHRFDKLTVSVDGATEETFKRIRGYAHLMAIFKSLERMKAASSDLTIHLKMTIQRENIDEVGKLFELAAQCDFIDGIGYGIPDMSVAAFGFSPSTFDEREYLERVLPSELQILAFERDIAEMKERHSDLINANFLYEGDLDRFLQRFKVLRGMTNAMPVSRQCRIPQYSMVLKVDGSLSGCYYLPDIGSWDDLKQIGSSLHATAVSDHSSLSNPVCQHCDQLLNRQRIAREAIEGGP